MDLVTPRQEDQHVAFGERREAFKLGGDEFPHRRGACGARQVLDVDGVGAAAGNEQFARRHVALQDVAIERRGHDDNEQIRARGFLDFKRARQGDVAVEMAFMKLVEADGRDAAQSRVGEHLAQQDALSHVADSRGLGHDAIQADLVADLATHAAVALGSDSCGEHPGGEPAGLEHDDFTVAEEVVVEEDLRNLSGFSRASGSFQHDPRTTAERVYERLFEFKNGQVAPIQNGDVSGWCFLKTPSRSIAFRGGAI